MKLRVRLAKQHQARYFSHLDLQRTMERSLRRADLPFAYTQGFNPHPRISYVGALATGMGSEGEFLDIELNEPVEPEMFRDRANQFTPSGLSLVEVRVAPEGGDSLHALLDMAEYRLIIAAPDLNAEALTAAVTAFLAAGDIQVQKNGKRGPKLVNIRPQVHSLQVEAGGHTTSDKGTVAELRAILAMGPQGNLKPEDLFTGLQSLSPVLQGARLVDVHRVMMYRLNPETGTLDQPWDL